MFTLIMFTAAAGLTSASALGAWNEGLDGDLSNDPLAPTPIVLGIGSNVVTGDVVTPSDTRDFLTFTIQPGEALVGLLLLQYTDLNTGGPGDRGFHAINAGSTSFIPSAATAGSFLGGAHLNPAPSGADLLPVLAGAPQAGTGFSTPLGPGTYSYLIQQTGTEFTGYSLDFQVIPAPSAAAGLGLLGLTALRRRR